MNTEKSQGFPWPLVLVVVGLVVWFVMAATKNPVWPGLALLGIGAVTQLLLSRGGVASRD